MPFPDESPATTMVIELEPGRIYVKIGDPVPEPDRVELLLRLTIDQWFTTHPQCVMDKTQPVAEDGALRGVHVWYHVDDRQPQPVEPELPRQRTALVIQVSEEIRQQVPLEHFEAVVDEAIQISRSRHDWEGTQVVVNAQGIAVILEKNVNRAVVIPVDAVYPALAEATRRTVENWLEAPSSRRHVILIDGSWFMPDKKQSKNSKILESDFIRTNIPYDRGPRSGE